MPARGGRGGGGGGRGPLPRNVQVSKKISWLLRHGAEKEGLTLGHGGFIPVSEVLANRNLKSLQVTFDELRSIVDENDKQRFTMILASSLDSNPDKPPSQGPDDPKNAPSSTSTSNDPKDYLIRANQGHSLKVSAEGLLTPITPDSAPTTAIHGTTHSAWPLIVSSGGLKPMTRTHVHFATGLPKSFNSTPSSTQNSEGKDDNKNEGQTSETNTAAAVATSSAPPPPPPVISGMRNSSTILIHLDVPKALEQGMKLWKSDNGVILSEGNGDGLVPLEVFKLVEDRTGEGVLLQDGKIVKEAPAKWRKGNGKG